MPEESRPLDIPLFLCHESAARLQKDYCIDQTQARELHHGLQIFGRRYINQSSQMLKIRVPRGFD